MERINEPAERFQLLANVRTDDEFVQSVELPGFDREEITVSWDQGVLNIAAEHEDESHDQRKTYHRRFPEDVDEGENSASSRNGILEVTLPVMAGAAVSGTEIPIEG